MKCLYHNDNDGKCSAAIVRKWFSGDVDIPEKKLFGEEYIPVTYGKEAPLYQIRKGELVIVVDFKINFGKLRNITENIIWIDHHQTSLMEHTEIKGIRITDTAACELTWEYFMSGKAPYAVRLIGDYDIQGGMYGEKTNFFNSSTMLKDMNPESVIWEDYLDSSYMPLKEFEEGSIISRFKDKFHEQVIRSYVYEGNFEGYNCIICNTPGNSQLFDSIKKDYDIMMTYYFNGNKWVIGLYTRRNNLDVSNIAKKYGGGGHRKAAGFICDNLRFIVRKGK